MDVVALVIAILGFGISATLAGVKVWETFLSQSDFHVVFDWVDLTEIELQLRFTVSNNGHRPDSVRVIDLMDTQTGEPYRSQLILDKLLVLLQPAEISPVFELPIRTDVAREPDEAIFAGRAQLIVVNSTGRSQEFAIPNPYDHQPGVYGLVED